MLSPKILYNAWQHAITNLMETKKDPHENEKVLIARCWAIGIIQSLTKEGYTVCIKKGTDVQLFEPSASS